MTLAMVCEITRKAHPMTFAAVTYATVQIQYQITTFEAGDYLICSYIINSDKNRPSLCCMNNRNKKLKRKFPEPGHAQQKIDGAAYMLQHQGITN